VRTYQDPNSKGRKANNTLKSLRMRVWQEEVTLIRLSWPWKYNHQTSGHYHPVIWILSCQFQEFHY